MEIRVQSIKFNADQKLLDFIDKKFSRIEKFYDAVTGVDVALSLLPDHENKNVKVQVAIPGNTIVVEKNAKTFEDAVVDCADILKEKLVKEKEKRAEKTRHGSVFLLFFVVKCYILTPRECIFSAH